METLYRPFDITRQKRGEPVTTWGPGDREDYSIQPSGRGPSGAGGAGWTLSRRPEEGQAEVRSGSLLGFPVLKLDPDCLARLYQCLPGSEPLTRVYAFHSLNKQQAKLKKQSKPIKTKQKNPENSKWWR